MNFEIETGHLNPPPIEDELAFGANAPPAVDSTMNT